MVERAKTFKLVQTGVVMGKLPRRAKLLKKNPSDTEMDRFRKDNKFKLDKEVIHYFAQPLEAGMDRRVISGGNNELGNE